MEKSKVKYGQVFGVPLYKVNIKTCDIDIKDGQYPDWYAAYLEIPNKCSTRSITRQLESNGADFIFLTHEFTETAKPKLLPHDIEVPVFELDGQQNSSFIKELKNQELGTVLTITMPFPNSLNGTADMELFYTPTNFRSFKYIDQIANVISSLNKHVNFEPFLVLYSNLRHTTSKNCLDGGKYCAPDPDNNGKHTGKDVVKEMLRQKCIYKLDSSEWIQYMQYYKTMCMTDISEDCSFKILDKYLTVKSSKVSKCVIESEIKVSGQNNSASDNSILEKEMTKLKVSHEMTFPALYINGQRFEGHVKSNEI